LISWVHGQRDLLEAMGVQGRIHPLRKVDEGHFQTKWVQVWAEAMSRPREGHLPLDWGENTLSKVGECSLCVENSPVPASAPDELI
jgi:hypothetical protein